MTSIQERRKEVLGLAAQQALRLPQQESGLWFHGDIRDNLYYAMHLFAGCQDAGVALAGWNREEASALAEQILNRVLDLQVTDPEHEMYGHWPLHLGNDPKSAKANTLPVELVGVLLAWFEWRYGPYMSSELRTAFRNAMQHAYRGNHYRKPQREYGHHNAKYTAQKLIWGELYDDGGLLEEGRRDLTETLRYIQAHGMKEYGSLPWFWHWVQSFACARDLTGDSEIQSLLDDMLRYLWQERALFYFRGAWAGAHSRGLAHDIPEDRNRLWDYIQFGDAPLPQSIARLEAAGLLEFEVPEAIRLRAVNRKRPVEVKKRIPLQPERIHEGALHSYVYITPHYALGGMWERAEEFDNEQQRWDLTLPVREDGGINQAYFFHPGRGYAAGDPRHSSPYSQVLFHRNAVMAFYALPEDAEQPVIGCLPRGEWILDERRLTGMVGDVYIAIRLLQPYTNEEHQDRIMIRSSGSRNGVVLEAFDVETAAVLGWSSLEEFASMCGKRPASSFSLATHAANGLSVSCHTLSGDELVLGISADGGEVVARTVNGVQVEFTDYIV